MSSKCKLELGVLSYISLIFLKFKKILNTIWNEMLYSEGCYGSFTFDVAVSRAKLTYILNLQITFYLREPIKNPRNFGFGSKRGGVSPNPKPLF